jgi:hypothetical protein
MKKRIFLVLAFGLLLSQATLVVSFLPCGECATETAGDDCAPSCETCVCCAMARLILTRARARAADSAATVLPRVAEGDDARLMLSAARRLTKAEPLDLIGLRREVSDAVLAAGGYPAPAMSAA